MELHESDESMQTEPNCTADATEVTKRVWVPQPDGSYELADLVVVPPGALDFSHWNGIKIL
jgi:hypothetical protein